MATSGRWQSIERTLPLLLAALLLAVVLGLSLVAQRQLEDGLLPAADVRLEDLSRLLGLLEEVFRA